MEMSRLTRHGTAESVSRDQILRHERGQENIHHSTSADDVQDWQPYPVDPYSCYMCNHTYVRLEIVNRETTWGVASKAYKCVRSCDMKRTTLLIEPSPGQYSPFCRTTENDLGNSSIPRWHTSMCAARRQGVLGVVRCRTRPLSPPILSTCPLHTNSGCGKERRRALLAPCRRTLGSERHRYAIA